MTVDASATPDAGSATESVAASGAGQGYRGGRRLTATRARWVLPVSAVVIGLVVMAFAAQSDFFAEDFLFAKYFQQTTFGPETLTRSWFGHLLPGYVFSDAVFIKIFGLSWAAATVVIGVIHAGAMVAVVRCLDAVLGRNLLNIVAGLAFSLSVGVLATGLWWAATLNNVAALGFSIAALGSLSRWIVTRRRRYFVGLLIAFAVSLTFTEKSLLFSLYAVLWCVLVVWRGLPVRDRLSRLIRAWPAWAGIAVLCTIEVGLFVTGPFLAESGAAPSAATSVVFVLSAIGSGFVPSLFGVDLFMVKPEWGTLAVAGSLVVVAVTVVVTIVLRRRVAGVWLFIAVGLVMNTAVLSRRADLMGMENGRLLRYHLEGTALFWLGFGVILYCVLTRPRSGEPSAGRGGRLLRGAAGGVVIVVGLVSAVIWAQSVVVNVQSSAGPVSRAYLDRFEATLPDADGASLIPTPVPGMIVQPELYPFNMTDSVLPFVSPEVTFTNELDGAAVVEADGSVAPAQFRPTEPVSDVGTCSSSTIAVRDLPATPGEYARVNYHGATPGVLNVDAGRATQVSFGAADGSLVIYLQAPLTDGTLAFTPAAGSICIDSVAVGQVVPEGE